MNTVILPDAATAETMPPITPQSEEIPIHITKRLIGGTSALATSVVIERGASFVANILAARLGGASTFGGYSLAITTANNISTYAAGGIGSTAARFSGKYPQGSSGYSTLSRVLIVVSLASAAIAALGLWLGAAPIAHLLHKDSLTSLLRWAALSASGIILLECARGFFIGQRHLRALMLLSSLVGIGLICLVPFAATMHSPIRMIVSQGSVTTSAVLICLLFAGPLGLYAFGTTVAADFVLMLREVWAFGFIQLTGLIGSNLAGWWLTTLVARADTTLIQMSFFAIASQLRNIVALGPSLLTETSYAIMADPDSENSNTPHHIMALCTFGTVFASLLLASIGIVAMPWALRLLYGHAYDTAAVTACIALAVAIVHMGNAPAAARLSIVSIRAAGIINTLWAIVVAASATVFLLHDGNAWKAMAIYLAGHVISSAIVLSVLYRKDFLPQAMVKTFVLGTTAGILLAVLALLRADLPTSALPLTAMMALISALTLTALFSIGKRHRWLPSASVAKRLAGDALLRAERLMKRSARRAS
jgi:O-antigen/teichoic acid export membrane protein